MFLSHCGWGGVTETWQSWIKLAWRQTLWDSSEISMTKIVKIQNAQKSKCISQKLARSKGDNWDSSMFHSIVIVRSCRHFVLTSEPEDSLSAGVPTLAYPSFSDQKGNAQRLCDAGDRAEAGPLDVDWRVKNGLVYWGFTKNWESSFQPTSINGMTERRSVSLLLLMSAPFGHLIFCWFSFTSTNHSLLDISFLSEPMHYLIPQVGWSRKTALDTPAQHLWA